MDIFKVNTIKFVSLLLVFFFSVVACNDFTFSNIYEGKVVKVLDGDSLIILQQGKEVRIRLAEIDAPEHGQAMWKKSKQALESYVAGKNIVVEVFDKDQYGRIVGHVYLDDSWINGKLVQQGYAYVYTRYAVSKKLYAYEAEAERSKRGLWELPDQERTKPWEWRKKN